MLGVPLLLGVNVSPLRALVQGAGRAWRVDAGTFVREIESNPAIRAVLNRYLYVFLSQLMQTATCTRFHLVEARLARWLLMCQDRLERDDIVAVVPLFPLDAVHVARCRDDTEVDADRITDRLDQALRFAPDIEPRWRAVVGPQADRDDPVDDRGVGRHQVAITEREHGVQVHGGP